MPGPERVQWIDAARGLGIIAIVLGHAYLPMGAEGMPDSYWALFTLVYAFHVPLFMFLSGLVFNPERFSAGSLVRSRGTGIVLPYFFWATVSCLVFVGLGATASAGLGRRGAESPLTLAGQVVWANPSDNGMRWNTPLWFLTALVMVQVLHWGIDRLLSRFRLRAPLVLAAGTLVGAIGYVAQDQMTLPWSLERALTLLPFFTLGALLGPRARGWMPTASVKWAVAGLALLAATIGVAFLNGLVDYVAKTFHSPMLWIVGSALGIAGIVSLAVACQPSGWLRWLGRASMTILVLHKFPVIAMQLAAGTLFDSYSGWTAPLAVITIAVFSILLSAAVHPLLMRFLPEAVGSKRVRLGRVNARRAP